MAAALPVTLHEYEPLARASMSDPAWDYLAGGSGDERTLSWNRERLDALRLSPHVLRDMSRVDLRCGLLGMELPFPVLLAPTGFQRLFHPEGELAVARGAGAAGAALVLSTAAPPSLEDVSALGSGPPWFQPFRGRARGVTRRACR